MGWGPNSHRAKAQKMQHRHLRSNTAISKFQAHGLDRKQLPTTVVRFVPSGQGTLTFFYKAYLKGSHREEELVQAKALLRCCYSEKSRNVLKIMSARFANIAIVISIPLVLLDSIAPPHRLNLEF